MCWSTSWSTYTTNVQNKVEYTKIWMPKDTLCKMHIWSRCTLYCAGQACMELSKEKSSLKQAESQTHQFLKTLGQLESKLSEQINYLTQVSTGMYIYLINILFPLCFPLQYMFLIMYLAGQPHEGSGYASQKVLQMAWHRLEHARSRVNELERIKNKLR